MIDRVVKEEHAKRNKNHIKHRTFNRSKYNFMTEYFKDTLSEVLRYVARHLDADEAYNYICRIHFIDHDEHLFQCAVKKYLRDVDEDDIDPIALEGYWLEILKIAGKMSHRIHLAYLLFTRGIEYAKMYAQTQKEEFLHEVFLG